MPVQDVNVVCVALMLRSEGERYQDDVDEESEDLDDAPSLAPPGGGSRSHDSVRCPPPRAMTLCDDSPQHNCVFATLKSWYSVSGLGFHNVGGLRLHAGRTRFLACTSPQANIRGHAA